MKNLEYVLVLIVIIICSIPVNAQTEVDTYLREVYGKHIIPGFSIVVVKNDRIWYSNGYGVESLATNQKFTPNTVSAIGSLTKSFTSLAVMQLVDQGKIDLDKDVVDYLPWFRTANKDKSDKITVKMLLNNTSGLYGGVNPTFDFTDKALENLAHSLEGVYIINEPGKSFEYSNVAFSIAGLLVSKVSGLKYSDYLEKNIFKPLQMSKTTVDPEKFQALNSIYGHYPGTLKAIPVKRNQESESGEFVPAGSITRSCSADLGNYLLLLLQEGKFNGRTIISEKSLRRMWEPEITFYGLSREDGGEEKKMSYCLGWMNTIIENRDIIFHSGSTGTMSSCTMIDTKNRIAASILMNIDISFIDKYKYPPDLNILNNVLRIASGLKVSGFAIPIIKDPTLNSFEIASSELCKYAGDYKFQRGDNFVFQGAEVRIKKVNNKALELTAFKGAQIIFQCNLDFVNDSYSINRNIASPNSIRFKTNSEGKINGIYMSGSEFTRVSDANAENYQTLTCTDQKALIKVPSSWVIQSGSSSVFMSDNQGIRALIKTNESHLTTFEDFYTHYSGNEKMIYKGVVCSQTFGNQNWQQLAFIAESKGKKKQCIIFSTNIRKDKIFVFFSMPDGLLTEEIQEPITRIIESFVPQVH